MPAEKDYKDRRVIYTALPTLIIVGVAGIFCLGIPINNWHLSILYGADYGLSTFSPLSESILQLFWSAACTNCEFTEVPPLGPNIISLCFFALGCIFLFSKASSSSKAWLTPVLTTLCVGAVGYLYINSFSIQHSATWLGLTMVANTMGKKGEHSPTTLLLFALSAFLLSSSSLPGAFLAILSIPFGSRKRLLARTIAVIAAFVLCLLIFKGYIQEIETFIQSSLNQNFALGGDYVSGKELPRFYAVIAALLLLPVPIFVLSIVHLVLFKPSLHFGSLSLGALLLLFLIFPSLANIGGLGLWILLPICLIFLVQSAENPIRRSLPKLGRWGLIAVPVLLVLPDLWQWTSPSQYLYAQGNWMGPNLKEQLINGDGDFLNLAGWKLLEEAQKNDPKVSANFVLPNSNNTDVDGPIDYFKKSQQDWQLGVFALSSFHPEQRTSASFPTNEPLALEKFKGMVLAQTIRKTNPFDSARIFFNQREYGSAVYAFKELREDHADDPELWEGLAQSQFKFHAWNDALKSCEVGLILNPRSPQLLCVKGQVYDKKNERKRALRLWQSCLKIDPAFAKAQWLIGDYYLKKDSLDKARSYFTAASTGPGFVATRALKSLQLIDSLSEKPYFSSGVGPYFIDQLDAIEVTESSKNKIEKLIDRIRFFIDLDSNNAPLYSHLGVAYMMLQSYEEAAYAFEDGVSINPNFVQMRQYLSIARTNWGVKKYQEDSLEVAVFHFKYALDYDPDNQSAKDNLSLTYLEMGKKLIEENELENGYGALTASIFYNRNNARSFLEMGKLKLTVNQPDSAEIAFNQAYKLDTRDEEIITQLIEFYKKRGDDYKAKIFGDRLRKAKQFNKGLINEP